MQELEQIQKQLEENQVKINDVTLLFLDLSSTCTGFSLFSCNFENKTANCDQVGAIWFNDKWSDQDKYLYLHRAITNYFYIVGKVDYAILEQYSVNMKKRTGMLISPEIHGVTKVALAEVGIKYDTIAVQSWRKELGIKPDITIGKDGKKSKDFKEPVKIKISELVKLPETIKSNITGQDRQLPNDVTDAIGIGIGSLQKLGFKHISFHNIKFQEEINF